MNDEARILTCVYCGQEYPQDTPSWGDQVLTDHIEVCTKHPLYMARATIAKLKEEKAWRPINTGPKDGRPVLLWGPRYHHPVRGRWVEVRKLGPGWRVDCYPRNTQSGITHWMPMPAPPMEGQNEHSSSR